MPQLPYSLHPFTAHVSGAQRDHALRDALAQAVRIQPAHAPRCSPPHSVPRIGDDPAAGTNALQFAPRQLIVRTRPNKGGVARGLAAGGVQKVDLRGSGTRWQG